MTKNLINKNPDPQQPDSRDTELKEKIISAAYGDLSFPEKISLWFLIRKSPEYRNMYREYRKTAVSVHKTKLEKCPDNIVEKMFVSIEDEIEKSGKKTSSRLFNRPLIAGIAAALLLAAVVITFRAQHQTVTIVKQEKNYSPEDVRAAEQQVKNSLAMISKILNKTTDKLEKDIIPEKISKPIKQGVDIINQLFPKGVKPNEDS